MCRSLVAACCLLVLHPAVSAQGGQPAAEASQPDELILTVRINGVERGEFTMLRQAGGDFWVRAEDLPRLKLEAQPAARRSFGTQAYYSLQALGAVGTDYTEADLSLAVRFPAQQLQGTVIDLAAPMEIVTTKEPRASLILSYRLGVTDPGQGTPTQVTLDGDLNVRVGGLLLRQAARIVPRGTYTGFARGPTQLVWDDRSAARRFTAGDVLTSAGAYGTTITGAGLMLTKLYDMTPDVIRQPTATVRTSTTVPAEVEVSVDGSPVYRGSVGPGPIVVDNLLQYGGTRNVQVVVVDASGRREVISQPFLFTDNALAPGFHEYNYFVGRRSELQPDNSWAYKEAAWQAFHRYGVTDRVTVGAGGEGNSDFTTVGGGITLRSDRLGLLSLDLLANRDREAGRSANGWSARYSYITPLWSFLAGRRAFDDGFRTFLTSPTTPFLRQEDRVGFSMQLWHATLGADWVRTQDALGRRETGILRATANLGRRTTVSGELQNTRDIAGGRTTSAFVYLRYDLDAEHWVGGSARASRSDKGVDIETGKTLPQGEGVGYRIGASSDHTDSGNTGYAYANAKWNLRPVSLEFLGTSATQGGRARYLDMAVTGAVVGVDGYWGLTREVADSFALARLGVPQAGVDVLLNNQVQGQTDERGMLFIPGVGAFGRQDVAVNDKQVGLQYNIARRRETIAPAYRSGTVVDFGGTKVSAVAGKAWQRLAEGQRKPIESRAWTMAGPAGTLNVETGTSGDFYVENAQPGTYTGTLEIARRVYSCRVTIPAFDEPVLELKEGIVCE